MRTVFNLRKIDKQTWSNLKATLDLHAGPRRHTALQRELWTERRHHKPALPLLHLLTATFIGGISGSPAVREAVTFLWPLFRLPVSISHLIKCTF